MRIELTTSSLPRKCSTPELQRLMRSGDLRSLGRRQRPSTARERTQKLLFNRRSATLRQHPSPIQKLCRAEDEVRTRDLQLGRLSLYQLSYFRIFYPAGARNRTLVPYSFTPADLKRTKVGEDGFEPPNS